MGVDLILVILLCILGLSRQLRNLSQKQCLFDKASAKNVQIYSDKNVYV